jgi:hypothetical protein
MAFVRAKRHKVGAIRGGRLRPQNARGEARTYYQLVETRREAGKVRQHVLAYLGPYPTLEEAIAGTRDQLARIQTLAERSRTRAGELRLQCNSRFDLDEQGNVLPSRRQSRPGVPVRARGPAWRYWASLDAAEDADRRATALTKRLALLCALQEHL